MKVSFEAFPNSLLVLDAENIAYRAYYVNTQPGRELRTKQGYLSGCFYGFFSMFASKVEKFNPEDIAIVWGDRREMLWRRQLYASYKGTRSEHPSAYIEQLQDIKLALYLLGIPQYFKSGHEADDLVYPIINNFFHKNDIMFPDTKKFVYIVSNDKDIMQLVNDRVFVIKMDNQKDVIYTKEKVKEKFGVYPELLGDYLALVGDDSDNIPGVSGIGPKTASSLLMTYGKLDDWYFKYKELPISQTIKVKFDSNNTIDLSKKLVNIRYLTEMPDNLYVDRFMASKIDINNLFDAYDMVKVRPYVFINCLRKADVIG